MRKLIKYIAIFFLLTSIVYFLLYKYNLPKPKTQQKTDLATQEDWFLKLLTDSTDHEEPIFKFDTGIKNRISIIDNVFIEPWFYISDNKNFFSATMKIRNVKDSITFEDFTVRVKSDENSKQKIQLNLISTKRDLFIYDKYVYSPIDPIRVTNFTDFPS